MAPKRSSAMMGGVTKRKRAVMSLREKIQVLDKIRSGMSLAAVSREYEVNESTIRSIRDKEDAIRRAVREAAPESAKVTSVVRDEAIEKMEKQLSSWINEVVRDEKVIVNTVMIREKARQMYQDLTRDQVNAKSFTASAGWLARFKNRYRNQLPGDARSGDLGAAENFKDHLHQLLEENGYLPDQVFEASKTRFFYKQIGKHSYISQFMHEALDSKSFKDCTTLLFCFNARGDFKSKPLMVYRAQNPRSMNDRQLNSMPVHWRSNRKAVMTSELLSDWFHNCFVPEVETYLQSKGIAFKVLLLLDHTLMNVCKDLENSNAKVRPKIIFMPPRSHMSPIDPFDEGVLRTFKSNYTRELYSNACNVLNANPETTVMDFWKSINIGPVVDYVGLAWDRVSQETINYCWKKLWPDCVADFEGASTIDKHVKENVQAILRLAHQIGGKGFEDLQEEDFSDILAECEVEITEEEGDNFDQPEIEEYDDHQQCEEILQAGTIPVNKIERWASMVEELSKEVKESDPILERRLEFLRQLNIAFEPYAKMLTDSNENSGQTILP